MSTIPYPGLRPFRREESDIFFGREEQTAQLLTKLAQTRFLSVLGLSGCGKSSLVLAGMLAALESGYMAQAGADWKVITIRPGNHPLRNLAHALQKERDAEFPAAIDVEQLIDLISSHGSLGLVEVLRKSQFALQRNVLLVVDQFEEIFRYHRQEDPDEAQAFVSLLLTSAEQREIPIYVVITMRSDYLGDCAVFRGLPEALNNGQFLAPRLTREQQRMAVIGPARVFDGNVEPRLVNHLLSEMGQDPDQLPLLQHCLMRMWYKAGERAISAKKDPERAAPPEFPPDGAIVMTLQDYTQSGGLQNALSNHADEAFGELNEQQQQIAETMFRRLAELGPEQRYVRNPTTLNDLVKVTDSSEAEVKEVIEVFSRPGRCFLSSANGKVLKSDTIIDISHESLIQHWDKMNGWVKQEADSAETYRRLEQTARFWRQGKAALWGTPDLEYAIQWRDREKPTAAWAVRYGNDFSLAMDFLDASIKAQEKERQQQEEKHQRELEREREHYLEKERSQWRGRILKAVVLGLSIAVILAIWAFREREQAEKSRRQAELSRENYEEMVSATFGFLYESAEIMEFFKWSEDKAELESLKPTLQLMVDSSEILSEEEKKFWIEELSNVAGETKLKLLEGLAREYAERMIKK